MKSTILLLTVLLLISCSKENGEFDSGKTYYRFSNLDYNLILKYNYQPNQIITYKNQFGGHLRFKVISNILKKEGQYSGNFGWGGSTLDYYYDNKLIKFELLELNSSYRDNLIIYNFTKSEGIFKNAINLPIWNVDSNSFYDEIDRPLNVRLIPHNNKPYIEANINGHLFKKVVLINSDSTIPLGPYYGGALNRGINQLYYDYDFGIIQFNDINGMEWKLIYPQ